nr:hypothetical protein BaRGS_001847 [Batillaria attramentaria]
MCCQLRGLLAKKQRENHAYINTSYNFVCNSDFSRLCNKRDIIIAGDIKPGSNTGDREVSGSGGEGNEECQDDYIAMEIIQYVIIVVVILIIIVIVVVTIVIIVVVVVVILLLLIIIVVVVVVVFNVNVISNIIIE